MRIITSTEFGKVFSFYFLIPRCSKSIFVFIKKLNQQETVILMIIFFAASNNLAQKRPFEKETKRKLSVRPIFGRKGLTENRPVLQFLSSSRAPLTKNLNRIMEKWTKSVIFYPDNIATKPTVFFMFFLVFYFSCAFVSFNRFIWC